MNQQVIKSSIALCLLLVISACQEAPVKEEENLDKFVLDGAADEFAFSLGYQQARQLKRSVPSISLKAYYAGFYQGYLGLNSSGIRPQDMPAKIDNYFLRFQEEERKKRDELAAANLNKSMAFLDQNKTRPEVTTTSSGLQYEIVTMPENVDQTKKAKSGDSVLVNYSGRVLSGKVFDSSNKNAAPTRFRVDAVVRGWQEGLKLMPVGAKYIFYIPPDLGFGKTGVGKIIQPNEALIFEVELLGIE